ncbi:MAG: ParB/RepB/Spo0J family partition protein [Alphaproteobacteria bacterium]|nr:ParB/RepB/Spo0J family partition protein [Alphaproteobacteria bacterium]
MSDTLKPNPKTRGLGRGLNALFEDDEGVYPQVDVDGPVQGRTRTMVGLDQLEPGKGQPRRIFKESSLDELADSIRQHGVLQPLLVREKNDSSGRYEIVAGERRWRAAQKAGQHEVPVVVLTITDAQAFEIALIENLQREDLDPVDEAQGYQKLMNEYAYTQEKLAESLGKSRSHIANMMRLLQLPHSVQNYLSDGRISIGHARALIPAGERAEALAKQIMEKNMSVRETEKTVSEAVGREPAAKKKGPRINFGPAEKSGASQKDVNTLALERDLTNMLGMKVSIDSRSDTQGVVKIEYLSLNQLDDVMLRLARMDDLRNTKWNRPDPDLELGAEDDGAL